MTPRERALVEAARAADQNMVRMYAAIARDEGAGERFAAVDPAVMALREALAQYQEPSHG